MPSSFTQVFGGPISVILEDGRILNFPKLKMGQFAELSAIIQGENIAYAKKRIVEFKLTEQAAANFLLRVDQEVIEIAQIRYWARNTAKMPIVIAISLGKKLSDAGSAVDDALEADEVDEITQRILGWKPAREVTKTVNPTSDAAESIGEPTAG